MSLRDLDAAVHSAVHKVHDWIVTTWAGTAADVAIAAAVILDVLDSTAVLDLSAWLPGKVITAIALARGVLTVVVKYGKPPLP